jgi:hypothetical protein
VAPRSTSPFVFPHGGGASVGFDSAARAAVRKGLRRNGIATPYAAQCSTPRRADRPAVVAVGVADGQHVGGTTTQPRSVCTRSPTKLLGDSSRRSSATAMFYSGPQTSNGCRVIREIGSRPWPDHSTIWGFLFLAMSRVASWYFSLFVSSSAGLSVGCCAEGTSASCA